MRRNLFLVLCTVFSASLAIGANNVVLNCPCHLKISCFQPLDISNVNETSCADENFVRCCSEAEPIAKQTVVISSATSTEPKQVDNISVVLPSEMSGIPQTTPSEMPSDYMIQMMDRESGNQLLLVFPKHEETTSDAPTAATTSTTPSSSSTTTVKTTEAPNSRLMITTPTVIVNNTVSNIKRKRISGKRRRTNQNNEQELQAKQKQEMPKPNAKIYDVSGRTHFLRRHHDTPLEIIEPPILSTRPTASATKTPGFQSLSNNELRFKIDQEHKTMIETLRDLLNSNQSPIHRPFDTGKGQRFKSFDELVNVEMEKLIENMKIDSKPYRGRIKFQDYKWAAIPDTYQEERLPPTENTAYRGVYKWGAIPDSHLEEWSSPTTSTKKRPSPYNELMRAPKLSDFAPSPMWSLQAENIEIVNTRNPRRRYVTLPFEYVGAENEFVPVVHNGGSFQIVGPIPEGFKSRIDDSRLSYDLPAQAVSNF